MTWEFGPEKNYAKLAYHERELEALFERRPELQGICQYYTNALPQEVAAEGLQLQRPDANESGEGLNGSCGDEDHYRAGEGQRRSVAPQGAGDP